MRVLVLGCVRECPCVSLSILPASCMQEQRTTVGFLGKHPDESSRHGRCGCRRRNGARRTQYVLHVQARLTLREHEVLD